MSDRIPPKNGDVRAHASRLRRTTASGFRSDDILEPFGTWS